MRTWYKTVTLKVCGTLDISYQGTQIHMGEWKRMTMAEAVEKYAGVRYADLADGRAGARGGQRKRGVELAHGEKSTKGHVLIDFFDAFVEDKLVQPTVIYDYPVENSPLAKRTKPPTPAFTETFRIFYLRARIRKRLFGAQRPRSIRNSVCSSRWKPSARRETRTRRWTRTLINALEYGLPPTGGLGMGLDRFVMLLTDSATIRDVILFPTMKPKK